MGPDTGSRFRVALSYAGEQRDFVSQVAERLAADLGRGQVFYDEFYEAEISRPDSDLYLHQAYLESGLFVAFLSADYVRKDWTGLEWRVVRNRIKEKRSDLVMLFKFDDAPAPGLLEIDHAYDVRGHTPGQIADLILDRLGLPEGTRGGTDGNPNSRRRYRRLWLMVGLAVLAVGIFGVKLFLAWKSHVLPLVPGKGGINHLPASEPYPQVKVVARLEGSIFHAVSAPELAKLKNDIQNQVRKAAADSFPCMEWVVEEERGPRASIRAWLFVNVSQRSYPGYRELSWIDLSFSGTVANSKREVILWTTYGVASTLDRSWSPRNLQGLKDKAFAEMATDFRKQELRKAFDLSFIANIPIADRIEVDSPGERIVVPLEAERLDLEPATLLKLTLTASLCPPKPETWCRIDLMNEGPVGGKFLRCQLGRVYCCPVKDWPPGFGDRLATRRAVHVYLAESHKHCPYGPENCPGPDKVFGNPGY